MVLETLVSLKQNTTVSMRKKPKKKTELGEDAKG